MVKAVSPSVLKGRTGESGFESDCTTSYKIVRKRFHELKLSGSAFLRSQKLINGGGQNLKFAGRYVAILHSHNFGPFRIEIG